MLARLAGSALSPPAHRSASPIPNSPAMRSKSFAPGNASHVAGIPIAIRSPDGDTTWHVGAHGFISVYAIEGDHYVVGKQSSGVTTDLLGGDAISATTCWVVGRDGTILRTTDGGYHWNRLKSPTRVDIVSVIAHSADDATIRTVAGALYSTADGGQTWKRG